MEGPMIGQTISHYKILEKLGEGGMGVVYKAHDTKLERDVALKFLPPHLSASESDKARFMQEARAAATLDHPNICTVYAIDEYEKQLFIAMQFVDGQLLRDRMGGMSQKQALEIGIQVAEGLAAAHEKGVVHRDIKPENIMVRKDGIAQIMDFGLAKLKGVTRLTKEGSTVGTAGYMSPEQIQGQDADHRSDIFSLGVLLYEMLTDQLPFKGVHETAIAYEIVNVDAVPMSAVKPEMNPDLDRIVLECLEKDPTERFQSAAEIGKELKRYKRESSRQRASRVTTTRPAMNHRQPVSSEDHSENPWRYRLGYIIAALLSVAVALLLLDLWGGETAVSGIPVRSHINLPDNGLFVGSGSTGVVISPDGKYVVYTGRVANGTQLFLHQMDQLSSKPIPGTENGIDPAFSPDGNWIVFSSADQKIVKISLQGGAPEVVCTVGGQLTRGLFWGADNMILIGMISNGIFRVPANGGTMEAVSQLDSATGEISHRYPRLLPDGNTILYIAKQNNIATFDEALIVAQRLDTGERKIVVRGGTSAKYLSSGHLAYVRGNHILAVPFDADRLEVTGPLVAVEVGGYMNRGSGGASFDISANGTMVFVASTLDAMFSNVTLAWLDRSGQTHPLLDTMRSYQSASLSPDGQRVAVSINAANNDLWIYHIGRGVLTRLTFGGGNNDFPRWSPDGKYVIYSAERNRTVNLFRKPWDGSGEEERLTNSPNAQIPVSLSPDGRLLTYVEGGDVWVLPMEPSGSTTDEKPWPFIQSPATETMGFVSPDGRWIAYVSGESGKNEVYVTAFPKREGKWQVSTGGVRRVFWSRNGKELFFVSGSSLMSAGIQPGPKFDFTQPRKICDVPASAVIHDVSLDGMRFLVTLREGQQLTLPQLQVVTDWLEVVKGKFAGNAN